jgi:hypothetical protein
VWMRKLLQALIPIIAPHKKKEEPLATTTVYVDNKPAIQIASQPGNQHRTKHWDIAWFWVRQVVAEKLIKLVYVPSAENTADIFTKALLKAAFKTHVNGLGLSYPSS